jgi:TniQ protein
MQNASQSLISRTSILQDESLMSLLIRLTTLNFYELPVFLRRIVSEHPNTLSYFKDDIEFPLKSITYEKLTSLTQLDANSLYKTTLHRFAAILTPPPYTIAYFRLPTGIIAPYFPKGYSYNQLRLQRAVQFCPKCLEEEAYYRLRWAPVAISACLQHECLLVDRCQACKQAVSLQSVMKARCDRCRADLTKVRTVSIGDDENGLLAQKIIQSWLMEQVTPEFAMSQLPSEPIAVLYSFLTDLQYCLARLRVGSSIHKLNGEPPSSVIQHRLDEHKPTPSESYRFYTTACKSLLYWPEGFHEFLFNYRNNLVAEHPSPEEGRGTSKKTGPIRGPLLNNLGYLYARCVCQEWKYPEFKFVQEAFHSHIADNYWLDHSGEYAKLSKKHPELADRCCWVSIVDAADFLEISPDAVEFLIGGEQGVYQNSTQDAAQLVSKKIIIALRANQARLLPLRRAMRQLGLNEKFIKDLARVGLLTTEYRYYASNQLSFEEYTAESIAAFLKNVKRHIIDISLQEVSEEGVWLNLIGVRRLLSAKKLNVVTIFLQLVQGNLWAYYPQDQHFRLRDLLFKLADIESLLDSPK